MFKKLLKSFGEGFKESNEEKAAREEKEKHLTKQKKILQDLKCPICGGQALNKGYVSTKGVYGGSIAEISVYHSHYNTNYQDLVKVCDDCGYVLLFADFSTEYKKNLGK